jgi:hypothetical protein
MGKTNKSCRQRRKKNHPMRNRVIKRNLYYKRIYVHELKTEFQKNHGLLKSRPSSIKCAVRGQFDEIEKVSSATMFDLSTAGTFYMIKGLDNKPHGQSLVSGAASTLDAYECNGVTVTNVDMLDSPKWKAGDTSIYYHCCNETHQYTTPILSALTEKQQMELIEYTLKHGENIKRKRDCPTSVGVAKRLTFGFTQAQGRQSQDSEEAVSGEVRILLPLFLSTDKQDCKLKKMQSGLRMAFSNLISEMSKLGGGFDKNLRQRLFGQRLANAIDPSCTCRAEFIELFVECNSGLDRHCDKMNSTEDNYNFNEAQPILCCDSW